MIPASYVPVKRKKKADLVITDNTKSKKKSSAESVPKKRPVLTRTEEEALQTRFGEKSSIIIDQLEFGMTDGLQSLIIRSLLQSLVEILPVAEKQVKDSQAKRGIYQFNQTIGSIRELLADVQAAQDRGLLGQSIVERSVRPAFLDISVQIVTAMAELESFAKHNMDSETRQEFKIKIDYLKRNLASYISAQYKEVSDSVIQSLT